MAQVDDVSSPKIREKPTAENEKIPPRISPSTRVCAIGGSCAFMSRWVCIELRRSDNGSLANPESSFWSQAWAGHTASAEFTSREDELAPAVLHLADLGAQDRGSPSPSGDEVDPDRRPSRNRPRPGQHGPPRAAALAASHGQHGGRDARRGADGVIGDRAAGAASGRSRRTLGSRKILSLKASRTSQSH